MARRTFKLPLTPDDLGFPPVLEGDEVIVRSMRSLLLTRKGERIMRGDVGSNIADHVFETLGPLQQARLAREIERTLRDGEPRVNVRRVSVRKTERTTLSVLIEYAIRGQTDPREMEVEVDP